MEKEEIATILFVILTVKNGHRHISSALLRHFVFFKNVVGDKQFKNEA